MADTKKFQIGLCLAGAISAGAYTAGVVDYLIEALEEWQRRKESGEENVPSHEVEISVIGGASAGGMTGIITASLVYDDNHKPVLEINSKNGRWNNIENNRLYHSWVDLVADDMIPLILDNTDIENEGLKSALNSQFIDSIAQKAVIVGEKSPRRKYFAENLKVFVTLSNLEGDYFNIDFKSDSEANSKYAVNLHTDYACFKLADSENDYKDDGWIPLNFYTKLHTDIAVDAAKATGAFPVGLKARKVVRNRKFISDLSWLNDKIPNQASQSEKYETLNIDGGVINNEPFENVRKVLIENTNQADENQYQSYDTFKSTILMIDPFPNQVNKVKKGSNLTDVVIATLGLLIDQARIKFAPLKDALNQEKAGQFLIAPSRDGDTGEKAIACGALGGFGGLLSKEFRIHDYFLGRANCEMFLRNYFVIPLDNSNPIFMKGYENVVNKQIFQSAATDEKILPRLKNGLQIIPIFAPKKTKRYSPTFNNQTEWPSISGSWIKSYKGLIGARVEAILMNVAEYTTWQRLLLFIGAKALLNNKIADSIINTILESLGKHKLLK